MKKYVGTKMIEAKPMTRGEYNIFRGWQIPSNENGEDEGFLVQYKDGYISWSPKKQFDEAYKECNGMVFGIAVELLKNGFKVARKGWNGKGMWLVLVTDWTVDAKYACAVNGLLPLKFIAMKTADDCFVPWLASQTDVLAEDWCVVE